MTVSLVGYTNAGKSTLMNVLAGSDVFVQDALFATNTWGWGDPNGKVPDANSKVTIAASAGETAVINCAQNYPDWETRPGRNVFGHTYPYQHATGKPTDEWVRGMMAHARAYLPEFGLSPRPPGYERLQG
jgi:ATPase subunit of ABC transporter with duplicated ATPase domains